MGFVCRKIHSSRKKNLTERLQGRLTYRDIVDENKTLKMAANVIDNVM